ncbi:hypothetical protein [Rhizobium leguminosarum]|nr:hypothetical protein [Rhizobium leguminosarum]
MSNVMSSHAVGQTALVSIWQRIEKSFTPEEIEASLADVGSEDLTAICEDLRTKVAELEAENAELENENGRLRAVQYPPIEFGSPNLRDLQTENQRLSDRNRELRRDLESLTVSAEIKTDIIMAIDARWRQKYQDRWTHHV